jgi:hypothetical protein
MLVAVLLLSAVGQTAPVTEIDGHMNHGYAVFVGTGWYKFDDRRVFVFRIPAAWQLRELKPDQMGIKLLLPVAIGLHNFDDLKIVDFDIDDVGTISRRVPAKAGRAVGGQTLWTIRCQLGR